MSSLAVHSGSASAERLYGLDTLRGIAALAVVIMHTHVLFPAFSDIFPRGYLAVDFFFLLSGYVMARTYEPRFAMGMAPLKFFAARYNRLWPTMVIGGLLFLPFLAEGTRGEHLVLWKVALMNLFLLPNPWSGNSFALNVPAWSIFFELVANLAHALLWRLGKVAIGIIALGSFIALALAAQSHDHLDIGAQNKDLLAGLARVGTAYAAGMLVWRLWGERRLPQWAGYVVLTIMPLWYAIPDRTDGTNWLWDIAFVALFCVPALIGGLSLRGAKRLSTLAGDLSFPLYATHYPLLYWFRAAGLEAPLAIVGCLGAAWLIVRFQNRQTALKAGMA